MSKDILLAFDIGNTNIVVGVFRERKLLTNWRLETDKNKSADEYGMLLTQLFAYEHMDKDEVGDIIISTVVPSLTYTMQHLSAKYFGIRALVVAPGIKTGLVVKYDNPKALGSDRIVNAVAALAAYPGPLIIIDYGTATTIDAVSERGEFLGGAIIPGITVSSDALFEKTAKLPKVELEAPGQVICRNTIEGIQAGVVYGNMGVTEFIVGRMKKEMAAMTGSDKPVTVIATGGMSTMMAAETACIDVVDKMLTLNGLEIIYEKNKALRTQKLVSQGSGTYDE